MSRLELLQRLVMPDWACPPLCSPVDYFTLNVVLIAFVAGLMEDQIAAYFRRRSR